MRDKARTPVTLALVLILSLMLAACSSPFDDNGNDNDQAGQAPTEQAATPEADADPTSTPADNDSDAAGSPATDFMGSVTNVAQEVSPAVVFLAVTQSGTGAFGQDSEQQGVGSGVIIDESGHILTNNHVIADADNITVILVDGREFEGTVLGRSVNPDIALVEIEGIEGEDLPVAELGNADDLQIGEWVVAIGNALGLPGGPTVTAGVIGALDRTLQTEQGAPAMENLIQIDAAINPGNSGGPLVNLAGEVVGINTAGIRGSEGIGFAVSIEDAQSIVEEILDGEPRPSLGIAGAGVTPAVSTRLNLQVSEGVVVLEVQPDSGAESAGLQPGDVITHVDGEAVDETSVLRDTILEHEPGDTVSLTVNRQGEEIEMEVELGESEIVRQQP